VDAAIVHRADDMAGAPRAVAPGVRAVGVEELLATVT